MSRKRKNMYIKKLIRRKVKENYHGDGVIKITSRTLKDGYWHCTWFGSFNIPDWFDATVREGVEEEIRPYCEQKYKEVIDCFRQCFGEVKDNRIEFRENTRHWFDYHKDKNYQPLMEPGWYTLICPLPPTWICIPDIYEWEYIDENKCRTCQKHYCHLCDNTKEVLVRPARLLTKEEINDMITRISRDENPYTQKIIKEIQWEAENALKYFDFVGGSPLESECWRLKKYSGINMWGKFSFPAIGEFKPSS